VRQSLNVESGLNDGMALPFFTLALAAAVETAGAAGPGVVEVLVRSLVLSAVVGGAAGYGAGRLLRLARVRGWTGGVWGKIAVVAVALGGYGLALAIEGSGFIAAWVAGLAFGTALRSRGVSSPANDVAGFAEDLGALFVALSYLAFGAVLLGPVLERLEPEPVLYGLLSLTIVRAIPVALALRGSGLRRPTVAFVAWFGPRGLASVVFGLIALEEAIPGIGLVADTVAATVGLSVLLHGVTSVWGSDRYGDWYARARAGVPMVESGTAPERPLRRRLPHVLEG
jgi:NhaP-type Na+/H+ or K+/H+ antiporter